MFFDRGPERRFSCFFGFLQKSVFWTTLAENLKNDGLDRTSGQKSKKPKKMTPTGPPPGWSLFDDFYDLPGKFHPGLQTPKNDP